MTKWNLTKSQQTAHRANSERLKAGGIAIGVEKTTLSESPKLRIKQSENSFIDAGDRKGIALALCLRLIPMKSGVTLVEYCRITIPGCDDLQISLVPPPEGSLSYRVFGWLDLETRAVLNHLFFGGRPLPCDRFIDGILVAQSFDSLPTYFQNGKIEAEICLFDQFDNPYTTKVELIVTRHVQEVERAKKGDGAFAPKQIFGTRLQPQVHVHPASAFGKTVSAVEENASDRVYPG